MNETEKGIFERERQVEIKTAKAENLKDIQELNFQLCVKESKEFDPTINPEYSLQEGGKKYFAERIKSGCALIATINDNVVGYLVGAISEPEDYRNISKIAEAENMYVVEQYRSLGIGEKLFQEFIAWSKLNGAKRVKVTASAQNEKAIEFYKKNGLKNYDVVLEGEIN